MRKRIRIAVILLVFALGFSAWVALRSRQPRYHGRTVSFWIQSLTNANNADAAKALEEIGLPALPYLATAFEREESRSVRAYLKLWNNSPAVAHRLMPEPFPWRTIHFELAKTMGFIGMRQRSGDGEAPMIPQFEPAVQALARGLTNADAGERKICAQALAFIGPNAREATPALVKMFDHADSKERAFVCQTFGTIGPCPAAAQSVRALLEGLNSPDANLTRSAADALGGIGPQAMAAIPALMNQLTNRNEHVRQAAVRALARIGDLPGGLVSQLPPLLNETNEFIRAGAAMALLQLNPHDPTAMSAARDCLRPEKPASVRSSTVFLMMGTKSLAELFQLELQGLAGDSDVNVATFARRSLRQVNPAAVVNAGTK